MQVRKPDSRDVFIYNCNGCMHLKLLGTAKPMMSSVSTSEVYIFVVYILDDIGDLRDVVML